MNRTVFLIACALVLIAEHRTLAQTKELGDETRLTGTLSFTCNPDDKAKAAGAKPFDESLELKDDRVKSKALTAEGFPVALSIPKTVNGVVTLNVQFRKGDATARYFVHAKKDGSISGSLTRVEGGKTNRYTIGATFLQDAPAPSVALDPAVLQINGRFVRLMSANIAIAEAGVKADKNAVNALLKNIGADQNALRGALLKGQSKPDKFAADAEARLTMGWQELARILGGDAAAAKVDAAYAKPYTAAYVYLNQMRAAVSDVAPGADGKQADRAVYQYLVELALLGREPGKRTPEAIAAVKQHARDDVLKAIGDENKDRFEKALAAMTSSGQPATRPTTAPTKP